MLGKGLSRVARVLSLGGSQASSKLHDREGVRATRLTRATDNPSSSARPDSSAARRGMGAQQQWVAGVALILRRGIVAAQPHGGTAVGLRLDLGWVAGTCRLTGAWRGVGSQEART